MTSFALSVDIGGTFTDFVLQDRERRTIFTEKVLTTPKAPEEAIFAGLDILSRRSGMEPASCDLFLHAHTNGRGGIYKASLSGKDIGKRIGTGIYG